MQLLGVDEHAAGSEPIPRRGVRPRLVDRIEVVDGQRRRDDVERTVRQIGEQVADDRLDRAVLASREALTRLGEHPLGFVEKGEVRAGERLDECGGEQAGAGSEVEDADRSALPHAGRASSTGVPWQQRCRLGRSGVIGVERADQQPALGVVLGAQRSNQAPPPGPRSRSLGPVVVLVMESPT